MRYFRNQTIGEVHGYDETQANDTPYIGRAITNGWTDITGNWPPAPTVAELRAPFIASAQTALDATDLVCLRCYKAGVVFPTAWQTYTTALRAIVNGTDTASTVLPTKPAYPSGT